MRKFRILLPEEQKFWPKKTDPENSREEKEKKKKNISTNSAFDLQKSAI